MKLYLYCDSEYARETVTVEGYIEFARNGIKNLLRDRNRLDAWEVTVYYLGETGIIGTIVEQSDAHEPVLNLLQNLIGLL